MDVDGREEGQEVPPPCHQRPRTAEEGPGQSMEDLGHGTHGAACGSAPRSRGWYTWGWDGSDSEDEDGSDSLN